MSQSTVKKKEAAPKAKQAAESRNGLVGAPEQPERRKLTKARAAAAAEAFALPAFTLALILFFTLLPSTTDTFPTEANWRLILSGQSVLLLVTLAALFPVVAGVWDFTVGATAGLASVLAALVIADTQSIPLAALVACGTGVGIGLINAVLITKFKINSVIATLGMTIVISGLVTWASDSQSIVRDIPFSLTDFGSSTFIGIPAIAWVALALSAVVAYVLYLTPYGRYLYAIGSNRSAARLVGLPDRLLTASTFLASGFLAGCAGFILLAQTGAGNPTVGPGYLLPAYAAIFLGAVAFRPGRFNVWGALVAVLFLGVLNSGLVVAGASPYVADFANGAALLVGVGLANLVAHRRGRTVELS